MSVIYKKIINTNTHKDYKFNIELFNSAFEMARVDKEREITNTRFRDARRNIDRSWTGIEDFEQAMEFLRNGHQETVDKLKQKINLTGQSKRFNFQNNPQGFAPIVPLALKGVPNCMVDMTMKPIKAKVIDIYYDMTCSSYVESDDIIKAGREMLKAIYELEAQGYRFNLYSVQSYSDRGGSDMVIIKIKSATQPVDLKRISFPICHTGFFRVIGFDWYSRFPNGTYRMCYGHSIKNEFYEELNDVAKQLFGKNSVYFSAQKIIDEDDNYIKNVLLNKDNNK